MTKKNLYEWNETAPREKQFEEYEITSTYITMRDGVKIAADIYLPKGLKHGQKLPTILVQTCYWRDTIFRKPFKWLKESLIRFNYNLFFTNYGFAMLKVDVRGTGASFGIRPYPWSEEEIADNQDIIEWIITQDWSDGNVITWGNSYLGTTAELAGIVQHPHLKGLGPMHNEFDPFLDIAFPGGIYDEMFIEMWARATRALDLNSSKGLGFLPFLFMKGVKFVDSDEDGHLLKKAIEEHKASNNVAEGARTITYRDDTYGDTNASSQNFSVYRYKEQINQSRLPIFSWGSWMDAATARVIIERFLNYNNPQIGVIGARFKVKNG